MLRYLSVSLIHKREKAGKVELSLFSRFGSVIKLIYTHPEKENF